MMKENEDKQVLKGRQVLVADDDAVNQYVLKHTLKKFGIIADVATNGVEVLDKVREKQYDLILMDIQMPLMDGLEATRQIRNDLKSSVPIIALTAFVWDEVDSEFAKAGINDCIAKPYSIENLKMTMEKAITGNDGRRKLTQDDVEVNLEIVYDVSGNNADYIALMIETFLKSMPGTMESIQQYCAAEDYDNLFKSAHFAKSSLSIIQVSGMLDLVKQIEVNAKSKINLEALPSLVKAAVEKYKLAEKILNAEFKTTPKAIATF